MQFFISQKKRQNEKISPIFVILYLAGFGALLSLPEYGDDFDWFGLALTVSIAGFLSVGARIMGARRFLNWADNHKIEIDPAGLKAYDFDTVTTLPWDKVERVKTKSKDGSIRKIWLKTKESGSIELANYENLDELHRGLETYLSKDLWQRG